MYQHDGPRGDLVISNLRAPSAKDYIPILSVHMANSKSNSIIEIQFFSGHTVSYVWPDDPSIIS